MMLPARFLFYSLTALSLLFGVLFSSTWADAQDRYDDRDYRDEAYDYCRDRAARETGYHGPTPSRYRPGMALEGAIKGARRGAVGAWVTGRDPEKAAKRGAAIGLLVGAIKQDQARERQRDEDRRRRDYEREVRACMDYELDRRASNRDRYDRDDRNRYDRDDRDRYDRDDRNRYDRDDRDDRVDRDRYDRDRDYRDDKYERCRNRAIRLTGYRGPTPNRYRPGMALEGAIKGARRGAFAGWVTGGDPEKAAKRGAAVGLLVGAIKQGEARERQREEDQRRREYVFEVRACMDR